LPEFAFGSQWYSVTMTGSEPPPNTGA
jgi:hypothetical protein